MSNSPLVNYTKLSPYHSGKRTHKIDKISIHHMAGNLSVETCGNVFQTSESSSNYGVGSDGRVGMYVEEANRSWCSSSPDNDQRAVTIEVANDECGGNWHVSDTALAKTIELCVDICKRNGIEKLNYTGDKSGNLTMHKWFANTICPGPYLESKFPYIAQEVNRLLSATDKKKSKTVDELANEVIAGKWGVGSDRRKRLEAAGYDYDAVQDAVNAKLDNKPATTNNEKEDTVMVELRKLSKGMSGNDVRQAMLILKDRGFYTAHIPASDKLFGDKMYAATLAFQKAEKIDIDGVIGKDTWGRLLEK